ncbi:LytS/YehU family sensor histidine kinase [Peptoniphilus koenoeneniae]|uniref:LytS/YehU family sensor histidine kinase n=1 Tax=Peptoniphilus koenoeneniae TaxID=507751 RepID=A0ABU0AY90_9FIRM|nr:MULTISPECIES: ECF transporter S component [Peptoniphilus]ERT58034.1 PF12822 family protein [Peptoniphilus sp. BV3C26]MDQ0275373.1 LytS/YehU family sensor histidine kinase [Peptoniphilus koenoeneniae]
MKLTKTKELVLSGLLIALGLVLPMAFHLFKAGGPVFLPMHIPVLLGGMILSPVFALLVGVLTPIVSNLLTSMPPLMPMLPIMIVELGLYGLVASILRKKLNLNVFISLIISMIIGRIGAGLVVYVMTSVFAVQFAPPIAFVIGGISKGIPGIIIQLIFIPIIVKAVEKSMR